MIWYGMVWYGMVWYGMYGMVWYGMVWYGMVWYGMVFLHFLLASNWSEGYTQHYIYPSRAAAGPGQLSTL